MSYALAGAGAGMALGALSSTLGLRATNKAAINQIKSEGDMLAIQSRVINQNREQLDRELGDILSANALATAKNMATAKVLMSTSGTVGGTTRQVSRQAYIDQILADADEISKARNSDIGLLNQQLSNQINFRNRASAIRSQIKSPTEAMIGTMMGMLGGAMQGAQLGMGLEGAMGAGGLGTGQTTASPSGYMPSAETSLGQSLLPRMNLG